MFFVVAILTKQFKIRPIKRYARVVYVLRRNIFLVVYNVSGRAAPLT